MEKTTLYLPDDLRETLRRYVRRTGRRQSDVVREALASYLAHADPGLPSSIGSADNGTIDAARYEEELRAAWAPDPPEHDGLPPDAAAPDPDSAGRAAP